MVVETENKTLGAPHSGLERAPVSANRPVYDGHYNLAVGKPVARPTSTQPEMKSVIMVGNPPNTTNMKPVDIADATLVSIRL